MKYLNYIFILLDTVLVAAALFMAWFIRIESGLMEVAEYHLSFNDYLRPLFFLLPFYYLLYSFFNLYTPYRMKSLYDEIAGVVKANSIGALVFLSYLYFFREVDYSRKVLVIFYFAAIVLAVAERLVIRFTLRRIRSNGRNLKHIVLVGYSGLAVEFAGRISQNKHWGYSISGIFDNNVEDNKGGVDSLSLDYLGSVSDLEDYISVHSVDEVVITIPLSDYTRLAEIINICEKQGVFTKVIPDYYKMIPANPYIEDLDGLPVISIRKIPLNDLIKKAVKRGADILVSLLGIAILVPFFLVISILIKCESKGPVIYKQKRVGFNRHEFIMYKFRSMRLQDDESEKKAWTKKGDPRITRIGAFIRHTSLDEFPQLFNVLKGEMSLIGPRPERPQFVDRFKEEIPKYMVKHQVRPGITGWAQVNGLRGNTSIEKRIEYDLYYIENWCMKLEMKIFLLTFVRGFLNKNAY